MKRGLSSSGGTALGRRSSEDGSVLIVWECVAGRGKGGEWIVKCLCSGNRLRLLWGCLS